MEKRKILKVLGWNLLCLLLFSSLAFGDTVSVLIPDTTGAPEEIIKVPILVEDILPSDTVRSAEISLSFNPTIIQSESISVIFTGTLSKNWLPAVFISDSVINIALAGADSISGSGALVYLRLKVPSSASPGDSTVIHFKKMKFNEGAPPVLVKDGILKITPTAVHEDDNLNLPSGFSLGQNYPNPFNPATTIPFQVEGGQWSVVSPIHTTLVIYNILGQKVRTLVDEEMLRGGYQVIWDSKDDRGKEVPSGVYFYRLKSGSTSETRKMVLMR
jgi:hypothetical protein